VVVLLLPGWIVGTLAQACCGVEPINLVASDAPDPVCVRQNVTISGTYTIIPVFDPFEPYDTGVVMKIWDPDGVLSEENMVLATGETTAPKDFPFSKTLTASKAGTYSWEVVAWSTTSWGRMEISVVGQTFTAQECNRPPDCTGAMPSVTTIWPPNNKFVAVNILGVTDPDGDPIAITITGIRQDEPVDTYGDGSFVPDGRGVGTSTAEVRAERSGTAKVPGDGRVYHIGFSASDGRGGTCSGVVRVGVPHDQSGAAPVDGGALYDSTVP